MLKDRYPRMTLPNQTYNLIEVCPILEQGCNNISESLKSKKAEVEISPWEFRSEITFREGESKEPKTSTNK